MKNKFYNTMLSRTLSAGLCLLILSGMGANRAYAQVDNNEEVEDSSLVVRKPKNNKPKKTYPTKPASGMVVDDATGQPMSGVRIKVLGMDEYSTLTEEDGKYSFDIPEFTNVLYAEVESYNPVQVTLRDGVADIRMISGHFNSFFSEDMPITAQRTTILDETSTVSIDQDIEKTLAGDVRTILRSGLPGIGSYMSIRGVNSLNANAQPLVVLDGNILDMQYDRSTLHEGFYNNILSGIDPENVESIQVLKNGTTLYGAKGANGVIIINTKRGKSMATKIGVRIYGGVELTPKKLDMLNGDQYSSYLSDMISTVEDAKFIGSINNTPFLDKSPSNYYRKVFSNNTDWQKDLYRNATTQNYKISVEGGDEIGMYALSLGYVMSQGTAKGDDMSRLNLRFNTDIKIFSKLSTSLDIAFNQNSYNILDSGWSEDYSMQNIGSTNVLGLLQAPFISPYSYYYDEKSTNPITSERLALSKEYAGKYASTTNNLLLNPFAFPNYISDGKSSTMNTILRNPMWIIKNGEGKNKNYAQNTQIDLNVSPKYQITDNLFIQDRFNYAMSRNNEKYFLPVNGATPYLLDQLGTITSVQRSMFNKSTSLQNDIRIDWRNTYGRHYINVFGGFRYNNYSYSYNYTTGYNNENDKLPIMSKSMQYTNYGGTNDNWIDMTYYLDANYNYKNRYFADFTLSSMASSRFGDNTSDGLHIAGVSWGVFPSLQLGWNITAEPWFKTGKGVQYLKLTAGVDQSGNDDLDYYIARTYWESQRVSRNTVGLVLKNIENSTIQWETSTKFNVGLQGSFLSNRLQAGLDFYYNKTKNLLALKSLSYISGMTGDYWTNDGAMKNVGVDFNFNAALINKKDWKWEVGATLGHYKNEITSLPNTEDNYIRMSDVNGGNAKVIHGYTSNIYGDNTVLTAVGEAIGSFYGWKTKGVFATDAEASKAGAQGYLKYPTGLADESKKYINFQAGDVHFVDQNGDGVIDNADRVVIGNPNPDIYGNLFTSVTWKDLRLDMIFKYSLGNDVYNYQRSQLESLNTTYNQTLAGARRWTYEGQVTDMPKACYTTSYDWRNNERMSDRWIENGSYLKCKNIRLTYNLPYANDWLMGLKVWAEANNVFTITKYLGTDPEMSGRNGVLYQGIDTGLIPVSRSFNVGISLNL